MPQLATQWSATLFNRSHDISILQGVSITTSLIAVIQTLINFVCLQRRERFVSPRYPAIASLLPIALWLLTTILASTLQFRFLIDPYVERHSDPITLIQTYLNICLWFFNIIHFFFVVSVLTLRWPQRLASRVAISILQSLFAIGALICMVVLKVYNYDILIEYDLWNAVEEFRLVFFCCVVNVVLGVVVLPSIDFAPRIFTPLVISFVSILRFTINRCCCCCLRKWLPVINEALDELLRPHGEANRGGEETFGDHDAQNEIPGIGVENRGWEDGYQVSAESAMGETENVGVDNVEAGNRGCR